MATIRGWSGGIQPEVVAVRVALRAPVAHGGGANLEGGGPAEFTIKCLTKLVGADAKVAFHAIAFGGADLTNPPVLKNRQRRQQDQQCGGDDRQPGRTFHPHEADYSTANFAVNH